MTWITSRYANMVRIGDSPSLCKIILTLKDVTMWQLRVWELSNHLIAQRLHILAKAPLGMALLPLRITRDRKGTELQREMGHAFQCLLCSIPLVSKPHLCQNHMEKLLIYLINTLTTHLVLTIPETITNPFQMLSHLIYLTTL